MTLEDIRNMYREKEWNSENFLTMFYSVNFLQGLDRSDRFRVFFDPTQAEYGYGYSAFAFNSRYLLSFDINQNEPLQYQIYHIKGCIKSVKVSFFTRGHGEQRAKIDIELADSTPLQFSLSEEEDCKGEISQIAIDLLQLSSRF